MILERVPALVLTGTVGSGKTAVATEIGALLERHAVPHAIIDLDWLGWVHVGPDFDEVDDLIMRSLAAIWPNLRAVGARRLVLSRALLSTAAIEALQAAVPASDV